MTSHLNKRSPNTGSKFHDNFVRGAFYIFVTVVLIGLVAFSPKSATAQDEETAIASSTVAASETEILTPTATETPSVSETPTNFQEETITPSETVTITETIEIYPSVTSTPTETATPTITETALPANPIIVDYAWWDFSKEQKQIINNFLNDHIEMLSTYTRLYTVTVWYEDSQGVQHIRMFPTDVYESNWEIPVAGNEIISLLVSHKNSLWNIRFDSTLKSFRSPNSMSSATVDFSFPWTSGQKWVKTQGFHFNTLGYSIDFKPSSGSRLNVLAIGDGNLTQSCVDQYQTQLFIEHGGGIISSYLHLASDSIPDLLGKDITKGTIIGSLYAGTAHVSANIPAVCNGTTYTYVTPCGCGKGTHLHFEMNSQSVSLQGQTLLAISGLSNTTSLTSSQAPEKPTVVGPPDGIPTSGNALHEWKAPAGAVKYEIRYSRLSDLSVLTRVFRDIKTTKFTPSDFYEEGLFYWQVRAEEATGNWSKWSDARNFFIQPPKPSKPSLSSPSNNYITNNITPKIAWESVHYGITYRFEIDNNKDFNSPEQHQTLLPGILEYTLRDLPDGKYYWHVQAFNSNGKPSDWSNAHIITIDTDPPSAPLLTSPGLIAEVRWPPMHAWKAVSGAVEYQFQYSLSLDEKTVVYTQKVTSTSLTPIFLQEGNFYWRVQARDVAGNWGQWSMYRELNILPPLILAKPTLTSPGNGTQTNDRSPGFQWQPVNFGIRYEIWISSSSNFPTASTQKHTQPVGTLTFTAGTLARGKFYWKVRAINSRGELGSWSSTFTLTIK